MINVNSTAVKVFYLPEAYYRAKTIFIDPGPGGGRGEHEVAPRGAASMSAIYVVKIHESPSKEGRSRQRQGLVVRRTS